MFLRYKECLYQWRESPKQIIILLEEEGPNFIITQTLVEAKSFNNFTACYIN